MHGGLGLVHLLKILSEWNLGCAVEMKAGDLVVVGLWGAEVGGFGVVGLE